MLDKTLITVDRFVSNEDATGSIVSINGRFECFGLEDEYRTEKVWGETRIPAGQYHVGVRTEGGFHNRYSTRLRDIHRGMLHVQNVPGFEYILIHIGNTDDDTAGCLLVGRGIECKDDIHVTHSLSAYRRLYSRVIDAAIAGNLIIRYRDIDRPG